MLRGEIRLVDLDPAWPGQADKRRPAVIVSNDGANTMAARMGRGVITVVPVTSNVDRVFPFQVLLPAGDSDLDRDSKVQAEQIRSVAVGRVGTKIGSVSPAKLVEVDEALRLHLAL